MLLNLRFLFYLFCQTLHVAMKYLPCPVEYLTMVCRFAEFVKWFRGFLYFCIHQTSNPSSYSYMNYFLDLEHTSDLFGIL
ncbi:unnamed protein product [Heterobilharzia americana]|nr:unnamed protein product [Heterobilharzia americana]